MVRTLAIILLTLVFVSGCTSVSHRDIMMPQTRGPSVEQGAEHLNQVADPSLPNAVYRDCSVGEWEMKAKTSSSGGNTYSGRSSQRCAPTTTRGSGYNPR
jgi:hypothetical protein